MTTVANTYGSTAHLSPLLRKTRKLGFLTADALLRLAVARGCTHYAPADYRLDDILDPGIDQLTDTELGVALISGAQDYDPQLVRCAAQLLSSPTVKLDSLVSLANRERCGPVVRYIAEQARKWDEGREDFWTKLVTMLPNRAGIRPSAAWPHPSRFMLQAGYRRGGGINKPVWLRPRPQSSR